MKIKLFFLLLFLTNLPQIFPKTNYCRRQCGKIKHVICKWRCREANNCKAFRIESGNFRKFILDAHNKVRNKTAADGGYIKEKKFPLAANMKALSWDYELERVAQCWVNRCQLKFDGCRWTEQYSEVGQTIFFEPNELITDFEDTELVVLGWISEEYNVDDETAKTIAENFQSSKTASSYNQWAQISWANTEKLGCARSQGVDTKKFFVSCYYGPEGAINGSPMFKPGEPCSQCANGQKCNSQYKNLCGPNTISLPPPPEKYFLVKSGVINTDDILYASVIVLLVGPILYFIIKFIILLKKR